jgi:hypothetical protein
MGVLKQASIGVVQSGWGNANMAWRWAGTVLAEAEKRFRRVRYYRQMPLLLKGLKELVDSRFAVA